MASEHRNEDPGVSHVTVDGIEGKMARVELPDGTTEDWHLASLPKRVKDGEGKAAVDFSDFRDRLVWFKGVSNSKAVLAVAERTAVTI